MTQHTATPGSDHPIEAFLCTVLDELKGLADVAVWSMDEATTDRVVVLAARVAAGVAEVEARVVSHADALDRPGTAGCRNLKSWLRLTTNVTGRTASAKVKLAAALGSWEPTRAATARGDLHAEQAQAIADQLALLDEDVTAHDRQRAEAFLLTEAVDQDADALATLGHEIYQRLDPDGADAREARALERQEARARKRTRFSMGSDGQGMTHGRFSIPTVYGDMLRKALTALAAPKHVRAEHGAGSYDWQTPTPQKMGQAFCDYLARFPAKLLPKLGGLAATVIAIGDAGILQGAVKAARLDTGTNISHTEYLKMACEAGVVPMWMDASGEVLSVGRKYRLHTHTQRLVLIVERKHCEATGCTVPGWLCHVHHRIPWKNGGTTDTKTAMLLCPFHHHRAHATGETYPMRP